MISLIFVLAGIFVAGITRSLMLCSLTCTSGVASYAVAEKCACKDAFHMSMRFVVPRILIFTCFGLLFGVLSFEFFTALKIFPAISSLSYFLMGAVFFVLGVLVFTKHDIPECKSRKLIFGLGSLTGLGCVAEFVFIEGIILSGVISLSSCSLFSGMLLSGAAMFLFALGLSIPAVIIITTAGKITQTLQHRLLRSCLATPYVRTESLCDSVDQRDISADSFSVAEFANLMPSRDDIRIISGCFLIVLGLFVIAVSAAKVVL